MRFLIVGSGGTGGCIGGFLASQGYDVTFIARGEHLGKMQEQGLKIKSGLKGDIFIPKVKACESNDYSDKADVIFLCVKGYSIDDVIPLLQRASNKDSLVIPILNGVNVGDKLYNKFSGAYILDGCVYISGFVASPGELVQMGNVFTVVFGARESQKVPAERLQAIGDALQSSGIKAVISDNIKRDTFKKFSFISPYASCGVYYNVSAGGMQKAGESREMYIKLNGEIKSIADAMGISLPADIIEANIKLLDSLLPDVTSSLQKDLLAGKKTEMDSLVFDAVRLAEEYRVPVPNYRIVAEKLGYSATK